MSETLQNNKDQIRCTKCDKLLARVLREGGLFEVKCPRCGTINFTEEGEAPR